MEGTEETLERTAAMATLDHPDLQVIVDHEGPREMVAKGDHQEDQGLLDQLDHPDS